MGVIQHVGPIASLGDCIAPFEGADGQFYTGVNSSSGYQIYSAATADSASWSLAATLSGPLGNKIDYRIDNQKNLHILIINGTDVSYAQFDTSLASFVITDTNFLALASGTAYLAVRDDYLPVVVYMGTSHKIMGTNYLNAAIAYRTVGGWTVGVTVSDSPEENVYPLAIEPAFANNTVHIVTQNSSTYEISFYSVDASFVPSKGPVLAHSAALWNYVSYLYRVNSSTGNQLAYFSEIFNDIPALVPVTESGGQISALGTAVSGTAISAMVYTGRPFQLAIDADIYLPFYADPNNDNLYFCTVDAGLTTVSGNTQYGTEIILNAYGTEDVAPIFHANGGVTLYTAYYDEFGDRALLDSYELVSGGEVTIGAISELTIEALPGTVNHFIDDVTQGAVAELTIEALPGTVSQNIRKVIPGAVAEISLEALAGGIGLHKRIPGSASDLSVEPLPGTVFHHRHIQGAVTEITVESLTGSVPANDITFGALTEITIEPLPGNAFLNRSITGQISDISVEALPGTVNTSKRIAGQISELSVEALPGTVRAGFSTIGKISEITIESLQGTVGHHKTIQGAVASLVVDPLPGSVGVHRHIQGQISDLSLQPLPGTVFIHRHIQGQLSELAITPLAGAVKLNQRITGQLAELLIESLQGNLELHLPPQFRVEGQLSELVIEALPGYVVVRYGSYPELPDRTTYIEARPRETVMSEQIRETIIPAPGRETVF